MTDLKNIKILIREDLSHFSPIGLDWYRGFEELGCDVRLIDNRESLYHINSKVDLFINLMDITDNDVSFYIKNLKENYQQTMVLSTVAKPVEKQEIYFKYVDFWFDCGYSHPYYDEWYGSRGQKFISILEAANNKLFYKIVFDEEKKKDFSFIGQFGNRGHGYRCEDMYLYPLIDNHALSHNLYGFQYRHIPKRNIEYSNINEIFNKTKVNLNFHYQENKLNEKTVITRRTFDIAASGNFQLVDHPKYEELTGIKTYPNPKEYIDAFYYYLNNPTERNEISNKAKSIILEKHTWKIRMENLLNELYNL